MEVIEIATARLRLRALKMADRDAIVALDADPAVRRHLDGMPPTTPEQASAWLSRLAERFPEGSRRGVWAAELEGEFIGWFHLRAAADTGECELGYRLAQRVWGHGLATEGSKHLVQMALAEGEARVIARTLAQNLPSRRVMEKVGMVHVRDYLFEDRVPAVEYAIERAVVGSL